MTTVEPIRNLSDIKRVESLLKKQNYRDLMLFDFGINLGLRISDILNLKVNDVKNKNFIQITEKKTGKSKKIPLNNKLKSMIKIYLKNKQLNEPLFSNANKQKINRTTAYRIIKKACKNARLNEHVGTHTLRKTFGYHFYKKHRDIVLLQKIFNHSHPAITLRYIGIEQDKIYKHYKNFIL